MPASGDFDKPTGKNTVNLLRVAVKNGKMTRHCLRVVSLYRAGQSLVDSLLHQPRHISGKQRRERPYRRLLIKTAFLEQVAGFLSKPDDEIAGEYGGRMVASLVHAFQRLDAKFRREPASRAETPPAGGSPSSVKTAVASPFQELSLLLTA